VCQGSPYGDRPTSRARSGGENSPQDQLFPRLAAFKEVPDRHLTAELLGQFAGVSHFFDVAVLSIKLSSSVAAM